MTTPRSDLPKIASLWIGERLSWLEQLCLKSFADNGHETFLYSYNPIENIPEGVMARDANEIFPGTPMLRHARTGSPAIHADMWRLAMLQKTDAIWVDADMYCNKPFEFETDFVFGWEKPELVCNAVLGLPKDSETLGGLLEFFKDEYAIAPWLKRWQRKELQQAADAGTPVHMTDQKWGYTGPASVTYFLEKTGEIKYAQPEVVFYPVNFPNRNKMIRPTRYARQHITEDTKGVHFWARRMKPRLQESEDNKPHPDSFMGKALVQHGINPDDAVIPPKPNRPLMDTQVVA